MIPKSLFPEEFNSNPDAVQCAASNENPTNGSILNVFGWGKHLCELLGTGLTANPFAFLSDNDSALGASLLLPFLLQLCSRSQYHLSNL
ncbi:hypothetical protein KOR42_15700 [Thalassoglobus neptunius]|uniref:Uncharacterized protein n=1 Tax=Thalassoglobus neptunius TaxID=1938619 RepID=A0A5C5X6C4_9PLAN|nr:hypothetical protein KOR42_15700 [Thalassoglobus neptunius]